MLHDAIILNSGKCSWRRSVLAAQLSDKSVEEIRSKEINMPA